MSTRLATEQTAATAALLLSAMARRPVCKATTRSKIVAFRGSSELIHCVALVRALDPDEAELLEKEIREIAASLMRAAKAVERGRNGDADDTELYDE
jgi:hypothetical protein